MREIKQHALIFHVLFTKYSSMIYKNQLIGQKKTLSKCKSIETCHKAVTACGIILGPLSLTWFNFNLSMDK